MTKKKDIKKKRDSLSMLVCRKVFKRGYKTFVPASFIVDALHPLFLHNRQLFLDTFCKREAEPLHKITADVHKSKRHVISMLRRIAKYNHNYLVQQRKTVYINGKAKSQYLYALVKLWVICMINYFFLNRLIYANLFAKKFIVKVYWCWFVRFHKQIMVFLWR